LKARVLWKKTWEGSGGGNGKEWVKQRRYVSKRLQGDSLEGQGGGDDQHEVRTDDDPILNDHVETDPGLVFTKVIDTQTPINVSSLNGEENAHSGSVHEEELSLENANNTGAESGNVTMVSQLYENITDTLNIVKESTNVPPNKQVSSFASILNANVENVYDETGTFMVTEIGQVCAKVCNNWKWTSNGTHCTKGSRIILGWNSDFVDVIVIASTSQVLHTKIILKADQKVVFLLMVLLCGPHGKDFRTGSPKPAIYYFICATLNCQFLEKPTRFRDTLGKSTSVCGLERCRVHIKINIRLQMTQRVLWSTASGVLRNWQLSVLV
ncbi:hypothetical protein Tco_1261214, partial [Tanacetum coccineum]